MFRVIAALLVLLLGVFPALAQDTTTSAVIFDGFGFYVDQGLAANVNISRHADENTFPPEPPYIQFLLYNGYPAPESLLDAVGGVRLYRLADFADYAEQTARLNDLRALLETRPDLSAYMISGDSLADTAALPFLPVFPAGQVLRARAQYVDTSAVQGISYVTAYSQAAEPFTSQSFLYTFQGVSADGVYYIAAIFRLHTGLFSDDLPLDYDPDAFIAGMPDYFNQSAGQLNQAAPEDFTPSLEPLDALIASFTVGG